MHGDANDLREWFNRRRALQEVFVPISDAPMGGSRGGDARQRQRRRQHMLRSEEHTSELQSPCNLVCRLLLEKKKEHDTNEFPGPMVQQHLVPVIAIVFLYSYSHSVQYDVLTFIESHLCRDGLGTAVTVCAVF